MVNHFEYQDMITEKDNLLVNMREFYESQKKNVFSVLPVTFVIDLDDLANVHNEIDRF